MWSLWNSKQYRDAYQAVASVVFPTRVDSLGRILLLQLPGFARPLFNVLHGMLPCDRTLFRCSKDPLALSLYLCSFWPDNGIWQLVWVSSFLLRDRSDEYQLTSFILGFKGMQFVTLGILGATNGIIAYFGCVGAAAHAAAASPPGAALPVACAEGGPGSSDNFVA